MLIAALVVAVTTSCAPSTLPLIPAVASAQTLGPTSALGLPLGGAAAIPGSPVLTQDGVFIPATIDPNQPVPILLALHGMGGTGGRIAERLAGCAEQNGWVLIAPTFAYRDYMDLDQVRQDDREDLPRLLDIVDQVEGELAQHGIRASDDLFVYGFSRGGQLAHRFAFFYPDRVAGVASLSAGSYTLPRSEFAFPFGVADLQDYAGHAFDAQDLSGTGFWVGVGSADTQADQVPRRFDPFIGPTRLERATRFSQAMQQVGLNVELNVFSGVAHDETALMRQRACAFLSGLTPVRARSLNL
jgi:pimeloyl-ACP methyl ester carboxylesterase